MKFGISAGQHTEWRQVEQFWRFVDRETRFHSAWVYDHFVGGEPGTGDYSGICLEAWTSLSALAAFTARVRVGVLVSGVTYRNPALLAKMAVTLDHVSNGRLDLGIGAAWHEAEHRMYGWDFPPVRERQDRLEEAVKLIRLLFEADGKPVSFEGRHYRLREAVFDPPPVQRPHPPIMVGGGGEQRTLRTAARHADMINVSGTPAMVRAKVAVLERHCRGANRDPSEIEKTWYGPIVVSDNEAFIERVARLIATDMTENDGQPVAADEVRRTMPVGNAAHVRSVVVEYTRAGIDQMIMMSQAPWKRDIYRRVNDEVVAAFA